MKTVLNTLALLAFGLSAGSVWAHATYEQKEVVQGATAKLTLRVPHGCDGEATLRLRVAIPEGIIAVKPMPKAGWTLETIEGPYETAYEHYGNTLTEGVREIVWTGELLDAHYDEFTFRGRITERAPAGEMLYIPAIQECANGAERWIEIPAEGQTRGDLDYPAPGVMVLPAAQGN